MIAPVIQWLRGEPLTWQLQTGKSDEVVTDQLVARPGAELTWAGTAFTLELGPAMVVSAAGLVCAALAQAFAHGMALADDLEGLV